MRPMIPNPLSHLDLAIQDIRLKKEATRRAKEQLLEARKAAGAQRRISYVSRSVEKAEREDAKLRMLQEQHDRNRLA